MSVGISVDTAGFAVASLRRWWGTMGKARHGTAAELFVTADCGGSNGYRNRLWKLELQGLADELGVAITVCTMASPAATKAMSPSNIDGVRVAGNIDRRERDRLAGDDDIEAASLCARRRDTPP